MEEIAMPSLMQCAEYLTLLNILIAFLGVFIVGFAFVEWRRLKALREDMARLEARTEQRIHASLRAAHRIIASYQIQDVDSRIALLEQAVTESTASFNGFNSLGYAWLEKGDVQRAIDAFTNAIAHHPDDKAGYCDLAFAHLTAKNEGLCVKYLKKAINVDSSAKDDITVDARFKDVLSRI